MGGVKPTMAQLIDSIISTGQKRAASRPDFLRTGLPQKRAASETGCLEYFKKRASRSLIARSGHVPL
jgi:hypothetical protein